MPVEQADEYCWGHDIEDAIEPYRAALAELVRLKDGPRDAAYVVTVSEAPAGWVRVAVSDDALASPAGVDEVWRLAEEEADEAGGVLTGTVRVAALLADRVRALEFEIGPRL